MNAAPSLPHSVPTPRIVTAAGLALLLTIGLAADRPRILIETDAGGDPDDEQSLVRFLLYADVWDVEGIIANRSQARSGENLNPERTGLGVVQRMLTAYGACWTNLVRHSPTFPTRAALWERTVAGYDDTDTAVHLLIAAVDRPDPRPVWYSDWGTDHGAATNNLRRALDRVLRERGASGYAAFKSKLRLTSYDRFAEHTTALSPPFRLWINTFQPELEGRRWYHRFSALTARAGGFDLVRDVLTGHGPLGALYPTNTTHWAKEGDSMTFLYLIPTGMNDPGEPTWGSWAGRYGHNPDYPGKAYYWANQQDTWRGSTHRDHTLARWAVALQNDFRARLDWCVQPVDQANHAPHATVNGSDGTVVLNVRAATTETVRLDASKSSDPDGNPLTFVWTSYPEAGTYAGLVTIRNADAPVATLIVPEDAAGKSLHVILEVTDDGQPALTRYRRVVVTADIQGLPKPPPQHRTAAP